MSIAKTATIIAALLATVLAGCATSNARFTNRVSVPTSQDREYLKSNFRLVTPKAGVTLNRHFFGYVPLSGYYEFNDEAAINELLYQYDGDLATDVHIEKKLLFLLYYNRYYVVVTGDVWRRKTTE